MNPNKKNNLILKNFYFWRGKTIIKEGKRRRYIGFIINNTELSIQTNQLLYWLNKHCITLNKKKCNSMGIRLIQWNGKAGIIRCPLPQKQNTIHLLCSLQQIGDEPIKITTVATSGTIKSLKQNHDLNIK